MKTTSCRTLEDHLSDVIGLYQINRDDHGDKYSQAVRRAIETVLHDAATPCAELGRTLCASCQAAG